MKHSILILAMLFLISSCGGGSSCNNDEDGLITENATVHHFVDPGFGRFYCNYIIEIGSNNKIFLPDNNKIYLPNNEYDLDKFHRNNNIRNRKVKITYRIIKEIKPGDDDKHCYIKGTKKTIVIIEIICIDNKPI